MIKRRDICFFIGISILIVQMIANCTIILDFTSRQQIVMQIIAVIFLLIRIFLEKHTIKKLLQKLLILFICFLNSRICDENSIFIIAIVMMASRYVNINKIIKFIAIIMTIFFAGILGIYFINYIFDNEVLDLMIRTTETGRSLRHTFFYIHPNVFSEHITWVAFMWLYLKEDKFNISNYFTIIILALFIYFYPNSRTNSIILILFIVINLIYNKYKNNKIIIFLQKNIFNICFIVSFVLLFMYNFNNSITTKINAWSSGRFKLGWYTNELFGVSLLGQELPIGEKVQYSEKYWILSYALDNFYYRIVYSNGILITILFSIFINKILKHLVEEQETKELVFWTILCLFGLSELVMLNIFLAFPLLTTNKYDSFYDGEKKNDER